MEEEAENDTVYTPQDVLLTFISTDDPNILCQCVNCVTDSLDTCDEEFVDATVVPSLITLLQSEYHEVKEQMINELCNFAEVLFEVFPLKANQILNDKVLPIINDIILSGDPEIVESLSYAYAALLTLIEKSDFVEKQLPILVSYSKNASKEVRICCVLTVSYLIQFFDPSVWFNELYEMLSTLASDQLGIIRSKIPQLIALYAKKITDPMSRGQLTARYILFCRDSTANVRQAAAEHLMTLSDALDQNERIVTVLPEINLLLVDAAEAVRNAASKNLGQIIASLGAFADAQIVSKYCTLLSSRDMNVSFQAAYAFPAVALALGKDRWGELASAFEVACSSKNPKVRRTLAYGLSSYAHLLDPNDLSNIAASFLRDFGIVAIGVVSTLHQIVNLISDKNSLLFCLQDPCTKYKSWRMRLHVSEQLRYCADFFDHGVLFESAKELVADDIWIVRKDAILSFVYLLTPERTNVVVQMAEDERYWERQAAASIIGLCESNLVQPLLPTLIQLCHDHVPNVRIAAASAAISVSKKLEGDEKERLLSVIGELKDDKDKDVSNAANNISI